MSRPHAAARFTAPPARAIAATPARSARPRAIHTHSPKE
jgi:hypothetical protein